MRLWRRVGRSQALEELELGGEQISSLCPMDAEELFQLLPARQGEGALAGLRKLALWDCAHQLDDAFLRALACAGCGRNLTSLSLQCASDPLLLSARPHHDYHVC